MIQPNRIGGGLIDRTEELTFHFNDKKMAGYAGDTLASALLTNGQRIPFVVDLAVVLPGKDVVRRSMPR